MGIGIGGGVDGRTRGCALEGGEEGCCECPGWGRHLVSAQQLDCDGNLRIFISLFSIYPCICADFTCFSTKYHGRLVAQFDDLH
jgi:hypothetical protein